ncbi:MAG: prolipoprotein diacylglyceryl transferase [Pseudomonadota bacterium]
MWPALFHIGSFRVPSYGVMLGIGILLGIHLARRRALKENIDPALIESLAFWVVLMCVLGARFAYTFVEHSDYYPYHPIEFFYFWNGGLAFSGSLVAAVLTTWVFCRTHALSFWRAVDLLTPPVALGLVFGKLGCFLAGCCYGRVCDLPWGVTFNNPTSLADPKGLPLHPTQIYEAASWLLLFAVLSLFQRRSSRRPGEVFFLFGISYGIVRFFLEFLRADPGYLGPLTTAQMTNIPLVLLCAALWIHRRRASAESL